MTLDLKIECESKWQMSTRFWQVFSLEEAGKETSSLKVKPTSKDNNGMIFEYCIKQPDILFDPLLPRIENILKVFDFPVRLWYLVPCVVQLEVR